MLKSSRYIKFLLIASALLMLSGCGEPAGPKPPGKYADVAKCLTEKGVVMYGAYWCPHCQAQKEAFGDDVQFLPYQECDDGAKGGNHALCLEKGVSSYPTWVFPGQGNLVGQQPIFVLAKIANCDDKLPAEDKQQLLEAEKQAEKVSSTTPATATTTTQPAGQTGTPEPVGRTPVTTDSGVAGATSVTTK
jgi:thiol-disulfide isomerase/thioredoxin